MNTRKRLLGIGIAAVVGFGVLAVPALSGAQSYRYRQDVRKENQDRNNALLLGAAGLLLGANNQSTLGTIALGGAAYEAYQLQQDINHRHNQYGYYDNGGYYSSNGYYGNGGYYAGNGYYDNYGAYHRYGDSSQNGYYDRLGGWHRSNDSWNGSSNRDRDDHRRRSDRDHDGDRDRDRG